MQKNAKITEVPWIKFYDMCSHALLCDTIIGCVISHMIICADVAFMLIFYIFNLIGGILGLLCMD